MKISLNDPQHWFGYVQGEFELLRAYVANVENQLEMGLINFFKTFKEEIIEHGDASDAPEYLQHILVYDGLDDSTWSVNDIFEDYFPSLHRSSCFITIYSFLEHSMEGLCRRYIRASAFQITPQDLKGTGIVRSKLYLQKVIGLDLSEAENAWGRVRELQMLRNLIVHNGGRIPKDKAKVSIGNITFVNIQGDALVLEKGFLNYALNCLEEFCRAIHEGVRAHDSEVKSSKR